MLLHGCVLGFLNISGRANWSTTKVYIGFWRGRWDFPSFLSSVYCCVCFVLSEKESSSEFLRTRQLRKQPTRLAPLWL